VYSPVDGQEIPRSGYFLYLSSITYHGGDIE